MMIELFHLKVHSLKDLKPIFAVVPRLGVYDILTTNQTP